MSYEIKEVDFVSGQEPDDEALTEWAAQMRVWMVVTGQDLARLLGVQQRVLEKRLEDTSKTKLFNAFYEKLPKDIEKKIFQKIDKYVRLYGNQDLGLDGGVQEISLSDNTEYWEATIEPKNELAYLTVEFDVLGKWDERW